MGLSFITEGAIPFAASNPARVIPPLFISSGIAGALSMTFGAVSKAPHGGIFAIAAGAVSNPLMYLLAFSNRSSIRCITINRITKLWEKDSKNKIFKLNIIY